MADAIVDLHEYATEYFLMAERVGAASFGHDIVDVFNENDSGVEVVEVFYERSVSSRTKHDFSGVVAERSAVYICCRGVG